MKFYMPANNEPNAQTHSAENLVSLQALLDERGLKLNANPSLATPQHLNAQAMGNFLRQYEQDRHREAAKMLIDYLRCLTMQELQSSLAKCALEFNQFIQDKPYSLIVQRAHSSEWIAELSLRHLVNFPQWLVEMNDNFQCRSTDLGQSDTLVLFDDCAYSGSQLAADVLYHLFKRLSEATPREEYQVVFVLAFSTQYALNRINEQFQSLNKQYQGKVHVKLKLIVGEIIPTMIMLPIAEEQKQSVLEVLEATNCQILKRYCLVWCEWKKPDLMSFPLNIAEGRVPRKLTPYLFSPDAEVPPELNDNQPFIPTPIKPYGSHKNKQDETSNEADLEGYKKLGW